MIADHPPEAVTALRERRRPAQEGSGKAATGAQHARRKLTVRQRVHLLFYTGSLREIDVFRRHRAGPRGYRLIPRGRS
jgi:acetyl-CoA carboxylase carboxyltransferase component